MTASDDLRAGATPGHITDIHDIRSLTATGPIVLPTAKKKAGPASSQSLVA